MVINVIDSNTQPTRLAASRDAVEPEKERGPHSVGAAESLATATHPHGTLLDTQPTAETTPPLADVDDPLGSASFASVARSSDLARSSRLPSPRVNVGKRVLLYCEMTGMQV